MSCALEKKHMIFGLAVGHIIIIIVISAQIAFHKWALLLFYCEHTRYERLHMEWPFRRKFHVRKINTWPATDRDLFGEIRFFFLYCSFRYFFNFTETKKKKHAVWFLRHKKMLLQFYWLVLRLRQLAFFCFLSFHVCFFASHKNIENKPMMKCLLPKRAVAVW